MRACRRPVLIVCPLRPNADGRTVLPRAAAGARSMGRAAEERMRNGLRRVSLACMVTTSLSFGLVTALANPALQSPIQAVASPTAAALPGPPSGAVSEYVTSLEARLKAEFAVAPVGQPVRLTGSPMKGLILTLANPVPLRLDGQHDDTIRQINAQRQTPVYREFVRQIVVRLQNASSADSARVDPLFAARTTPEFTCNFCPDLNDVLTVVGYTTIVTTLVFCEYGTAGLGTFVCVAGADAATAAAGLSAVQTIKNAPPPTFEYVDMTATCTTARDCSSTSTMGSAIGYPVVIYGAWDFGNAPPPFASHSFGGLESYGYYDSQLNFNYDGASQGVYHSYWYGSNDPYDVTGCFPFFQAQVYVTFSDGTRYRDAFNGSKPVGVCLER